MVVGARQTTGLAVFTVFGNAFSSAVQFLLLWLIQGAPDTLAPYVGVWWLGQLFGFSSSMAQMILVSSIAPRESRGYWGGLRGAAENAAKFCGPLLLALLYGEQRRDAACLVVCGAVSLLAALAYLPLPRLLPAPGAKEVELEEMTVYEAMRPVEFMNLSLELRLKIDAERKKQGKKSFTYGWGKADPGLEPSPSSCSFDLLLLGRSGPVSGQAPTRSSGRTSASCTGTPRRTSSTSSACWWTLSQTARSCARSATAACSGARRCRRASWITTWRSSRG